MADDVGDVLADAASVLERIVMWWENIQFRSLIPLCHRFVTYTEYHILLFFSLAILALTDIEKCAILNASFVLNFFSNKIKTIILH